jgi:hypothetical protein
MMPANLSTPTTGGGWRKRLIGNRAKTERPVLAIVERRSGSWFIAR